MSLGKIPGFRGTFAQRPVVDSLKVDSLKKVDGIDCFSAALEPFCIRIALYQTTPAVTICACVVYITHLIVCEVSCEAKFKIYFSNVVAFLLGTATRIACNFYAGKRGSG